MARDVVRGTRAVHRVRVRDATEQGSDLVAHEEPLEIRVGGVPLAVLLRTPGHDADLAAGYVLTEGVVADAADIDDVVPCATAPAEAAGNIVDVLLRPGAAPDLRRFQRPRHANSACGTCGAASLDNLLAEAPPLVDGRCIPGAVVRGLPDALRQRQPGFAATGGLHAAAALDDAGALQDVREDVGRHNAVDKTLGAWAVRGRGRAALGVVVSSRAGFEIVQKAHVLRVPVVVSVGAPTSLAVELALRAGLTLVAFAGAAGFNIYAHGHRIG
ncbi:MAG: formate dehydrogenase accessory sulfurtransferase FdhD [Deltaproteobacteria bacterium]|nr:formate dehydrogenase accessory sulfurtransferase FdhD [Deltaproteobacteria bacterium]